MISAFMVLAILFSLSGCDNEGIVGEGLTSGNDRVETTTVEITNLEIVEGEGFSGNLSNSGMGIVDDPAYGTVFSSVLLKPSINNEDLEFFSGEFTFKLILEFNSLKYGNENTVSNYNIYEVNQRWRGREITYNNPVSFDESKLIGSFQVLDESTVEVNELDSEWVDRYREFFNDDSSRRDSLFRAQFNGIAIVPADQNQKIDFLRHTATVDDEDDDEDGEDNESRITRFLVENDQDSVVATIPLIDHGASMVRTDEPGDVNDIVLHSTFENILKADLDMGPEDYEGSEIVNVQLVLTEKPEPTPSDFVRPETELIRAHFFRSDPVNVASEIFARTPAFGAVKSDDEPAQFRINVTNYLIDKIFGEIETTPLFLTNQGNNGLLYSTTFHGTDADADLRPRLIITTINPDN